MNEGMFVAGLLLIIAGIFGVIYEVSNHYPYRQLGVAGIVIGVVLLIVGAAVPTVTTETQTISREMPVKKKTIVREEI